ncbi:metalloprotease [Lactococcus fujiensis JCM 16395]|uniref:Endoribonuclease YbeY n=2 Tax=Lactococcus fujiensis TaxID=610251 RepID=A0A2A5RK13_9LACT|nr:metalloprotease [Lactococcus fujiensis JCM 16395]
MIDETGKLPSGIMEQSQKLLDFAADYIKLPESKEMAVTFVDNKRSHELNLEYRETDRPTDVISLEYKPDNEEFFFDEDMELPEELLEEMDPFIGELFISIEKAAEQAQDYGHSIEREYGWLVVHGFLHINGYDHYTPEEEAEMFGLQEEILTAYGLTR